MGHDNSFFATIMGHNISWFFFGWPSQFLATTMHTGYTTLVRLWANKKKRRLAIVLNHRVCNITIILGIFCPENNKKIFFHYRGCFFSLSWVLFHNCWCFFHIPYTVIFNMCLHHLGIYRKCLMCFSTSVF